MNNKRLSIQVHIKHVYGNETVYPMCEAAKNFAKIANSKTLTPRVIGLIQALGYFIEVKTLHSDLLIEQLGE